MNPKLSAYLDSLVPKNLSEKRRKVLFDELQCHILDKADRYEEIGYSKEESLDLALRDMGEDEKTKEAINGEFESLYREKTCWAILAGVLIFVLNLLCARFGQFVTSADYLGDPDFTMNLTSFGIIFVMLFIVVAARSFKLRKTLISVGAADLIIAASLLLCLFPQAALFSIETNIMYLLDKFSPFSMWSEIKMGATLFYPFGCMAFLFACGIYCFVSARKIKNGSAKKTRPFSKRIIAFCGAYLLVAVFTCALYPTAHKHIEYDIPTYINSDNSYISKNSGELYSLIEHTDDYEKAAQILTANGMVNAEDFKKTLDNSKRNALSKQIKKLKLEDKTFEVWFYKESPPNGNGLIFLKKDENGKIAARGVGNGAPFGAKGEYNIYTFYFMDEYIGKPQKAKENFASLQKGQSKEDVLKLFNGGEIYSKFNLIENGKSIDLYLIYFKNPKLEVNIELVFTDGTLTDKNLIEHESLDTKAY